jgi:hypothetical protein
MRSRSENIAQGAPRGCRNHSNAIDVLKPFKNGIEEASDNCDFPIAEIRQEPQVELGQYRSRRDRFCQSLLRRENVRDTAILVRKLATNQARILHSANKSRYRGSIDAHLITDILEHRARLAFEHPKNTKLGMADAKRFLEGRVGKFEKSVLRQRHEMKEAWLP